MAKFRTKLVLTLLVITLLPVFPVYYLVKNLMQKSLEIGYNQNVEMALQHASGMAQKLYSEYKNETLATAKQLAASPWAKTILAQQNGLSQSSADKVKLVGEGKIDIYNKNGEVIFSDGNSPGHPYPALYRNTIAGLAKKDQAEILNLANDSGHILAFAPIMMQGKSSGFIVVTKIVDEDFVQASEQIVSVHQMFKTLDFFEGDLTQGFLLTFFAVYAPIAALSIALGIYFSRKITSPLLSLVQGTKRVAAGDWDYRVRATSRDEIGELVQAFNAMVATLKEQQEQVIALEKMALWREIARVLAHEIKNPLTPIQLTVQQIKDKYRGDDPEYRRLIGECTEIINDEIETLRTLVREFSEFARMPKLELTPGNINDLTEEVAKLYSNERLSMDLDPQLPEINFDYEKMRRVLINLLENSLDSIHQKGAGEIRIRTSLEGGDVVIQHSDTGAGIAEDVRDKIFEPYFSTKKSGVGLGLAIVKRIVEEHGGTITVESLAGKGTDFYIRWSIAGH